MSEPVIGIVGLGRLGGTLARKCAEEGVPVLEFDPRHPEKWESVPAPQVLVDCGAAPAVRHTVEMCGRLGVPLVECVSDLDEEHLRLLDGLARQVPVVRAVNLSLGNYLMTRAMEQVARTVRIMERGGITGIVPEAAVFERHPATKAHRPSATATALAGRWEEATGSAASDVASLRAGGPVSDHGIRLTWPEQTFTVRHDVLSLDAAASGAIGVAGWTVGREPGHYAVHDIFDDMLATMDASASAAQGGDRA